MTVSRGEIRGLIGNNGAGKTTLIKCITGIYKPDDGSVLYDDEKIYDNLYSYANKHSELKISDSTNFEWDCAYIDYQHYGNGENIKQKYNLECNLETLETDYCFRIIFFIKIYNF